MKKTIYTNNAPKPIGPYSQAVFTSSTNKLYISGQISINPKSNTIEKDNIKDQTKQVMNNIKAILDYEKLNFNNLIKVEVYLKDISHFTEFNSIYNKYFKKNNYPARVVVEVSKLPKNSLIEISAIAGYL